MALALLRLPAIAAGVVALGIGLAACGSTPTPAESPSPTASPDASVPAVANGAGTVSFSKVVDLSQVISEDIPLWPGDPKVVFKTAATLEKDGYYLRSLTIGEHSGTHMTASNSFIAQNSQDITSYTAAQRVVPAAVIDARDKCAANPDYELTQQDVLDWEAANGKLAPGTFFIMYTGWEDKWNDPQAFFGQDAEGNLHYPGFAPALGPWLVKERQVAGLGIDTHGLDPGSDTAYSTNAEMARTHKIAIECMGHLDELPTTGAIVVLAPLQLKDGSASPMDIIALVP
jgi:kynurenine formamidase